MNHTLALPATIALRRSPRQVHDLVTMLDEQQRVMAGHPLRVGHYAEQLAVQLGLGDALVDEIGLAASFHDLGKLAVPEALLESAEALTGRDWEVMKGHAVLGHAMLAPRPTLELAARVALTHHEWFDGSGYPHGLRGEQIPLASRLVALVDVYDALRSDRPYKRAWSHHRVVRHIKERGGSHFDPRIVDAFLALEQRFEAISRQDHFSQA